MVLKGTKMSEESKLKISLTLKGYKHTLEAKKNMSKSQIGHKGYWKGKKFSNETRRKISESNKGKTISEEHRQKIIKSLTGRKHSEEAKKKMSLSKLGSTPWNKDTKGIMKLNKTSFKKGQIPWNKGLTKVTDKRIKESWNKGKPPSEETKRKISESNKSNIAWNKGKHGCYNEETLKKMSEAHKGQVAWNKGKILPKGFKHSETTKKLMSEKLTGRIGAMTGKKFTKEHKRNISAGHQGIQLEDWIGFVSFEPYSTDWTYALKESIRIRDYHTCQVCKTNQKDLKTTLSIHHIDYDKKNCNPENLITLCKKCHAKTNGNRTHWKKYFKELNL